MVMGVIESRTCSGNAPDLRGARVLLTGLELGHGVDAARAFGTLQFGNVVACRSNIESEINNRSCGSPSNNTRSAGRTPSPTCTAPTPRR